MNDNIKDFCEAVFKIVPEYGLTHEELVKAASGMMYAFGSKIEDRTVAKNTIKYWALMTVSIVNGEEKEEKENEGNSRT